jgi:hypothetical protein
MMAGTKNDQRIAWQREARTVRHRVGVGWPDKYTTTYSDFTRFLLL